MLKRKRNQKPYTYEDLKRVFIGSSILHLFLLFFLFIKDLATSNVFIIILIFTFIIRVFNVYMGFGAAEKTVEKDRKMIEMEAFEEKYSEKNSNK